MKIKFLCILIASFIAINITAQEKIKTSTYNSFQTWAKQLKIPGFTLAETENEENNTYVANFMAGTTKFMQLRVSDISQYEQNLQPALKPQKYVFEQKNAAYIYFSDVSMLVVAYPKLELCVMVSSSGKVDKAALEAVLRNSNIDLLRK